MTLIRKRRIQKMKHYWYVIRNTPLTDLLSAFSDRAKRRLRLKLQRFEATHLYLRRFWNGKDKSYPSLRKDVDFFCFRELETSRDDFLSALANLFPGSVKSIIGSADKVLDHCFDLLGSGPVSLGYPIDWHRDFKSGKKWDQKYFEDIKEVEINNNADIKIPWELSRCYHFIILGKAFVYTNDEKYAKEFIRQFEDWIENNTPYYGVNWHCSMEVAFRAVNWIWAYYLCSGSESFTSEKKAKLIDSLVIHGRYIYNNLEFDRRVINGAYVRVNGNHYLADLVGLIYLGLLIPSSEAEQWLKKGVQELITEIEQQVLTDGVHWELAPSYHRLVVEMVISTIILCTQNGLSFPDGTLSKVKSMFTFIKHYIKPNHLCPLVRDADDGRLYLIGGNDFRDHRHLLPVGAVFFNEGDLLSQNTPYSEDAWWLLGSRSYQHFKKLVTKTENPRSTGFIHSQYFILRHNLIHLFVSCADIGMKGHYGGHSHNDCLGFEFFCHEETFITDCGSYIYSGDPPLRNLFRSTEYHNTARVDSEEINRFHPEVLFGMESDAKPALRAWITKDDYDYLEAEHYGFQRLPNPVIHNRSFYLDKKADCLVIEDGFAGTGEHKFELFFHLHPDVSIERLDESTFKLRHMSGLIYISFIYNQPWDIAIDEGWISYRYGIKKTAKRIVVSGYLCTPVSIMTGIIVEDGEPYTNKYLSQEGILNKISSSVQRRPTGLTTFITNSMGNHNSTKANKG